MNGVIFVIHQLICGTKELINLYVKNVAKNIKYQNYKNHIRTIRNQRVRRQFYFIAYNGSQISEGKDLETKILT